MAPQVSDSPDPELLQELTKVVEKSPSVVKLRFKGASLRGPLQHDRVCPVVAGRVLWDQHFAYVMC
jgi:hypothetical protein